jgi:hypothetical protein
MTRRPLAVTLGLLLAMVAGGGARGNSAPPDGKTSTPSVPRLGDAAVAEIQALAKGRPMEDFTGLSDLLGLTQAIYVHSSRANVAFKTARAAAFGKRYTPPPEDRADVLEVECGDTSRDHIFNCKSVEVRSDRGVVRPLSYEAGTTAHTEDGARWTVREVKATYPLDGLRFGFSIHYVSLDGSEHTFGVSPQKAQGELLLNLKSQPAR